MRCLRCDSPSDFCVCDKCAKALTPLLQKKVSEGEKGIEERGVLFFRYLDRINTLARPA